MVVNSPTDLGGDGGSGDYTITHNPGSSGPDTNAPTDGTARPSIALFALAVIATGAIVALGGDD